MWRMRKKIGKKNKTGRKGSDNNGRLKCRATIFFDVTEEK
jgi:hypothetical protein